MKICSKPKNLRLRAISIVPVTDEMVDLHGQVDGRVESQTTLVGTKGRVELHAVTLVDLQLALVIFPDDSKLNDTLRDSRNLESSAVLRVLCEEGAVLKSACQLYYSSATVVSPNVDSLIAYLGKLARTRAQQEGFSY